tara:strand:- start:11001 stop:12830 length:1830 start_codon:yes stop_codon:yes gene_type:complete
MSVLQKLTEGIVNRNLQKEGSALLEKWENTGLLEGLDDNSRQSMAVLLENQAKELLREASSMAGGDVEGFAAVAFPIVRRVFGGLIANQLVSVQPMSLPSGLIFFMDFTFTDNRGDTRSGDSLYGGGVVASQLTGGVDLAEETGLSGVASLGSNAEKGFYALNNGYASPTGSVTLAAGKIAPASAVTAANGYGGSTADLAAFTAVSALTDAQKNQLRHDPDLLNTTSTDTVQQVLVTLTNAQRDAINWDSMIAIDIRPSLSGSGVAFGLSGDEAIRPVRRLTRRSSSNVLLFTLHGNSAAAAADSEIAIDLIYPLTDTFTAANALGGIKGTDPWGLEGAGSSAGQFDSLNRNQFPEIDIKVDSVAVTAVTKKLKAKWSPELAQDLNAYHNLDAEVELTSILSEQIALEIDREILNDLVQGATAGKFYWSRRPGRFVNRATGSDISTYANESLLGADFTGTVSEWYETLVETINDISANIHRKTLRGGANFIVVSPETANILEFTAGFRASVTHDADTGSVGAVKVGALSKKWDVYVDPYFPRNVVLVGRKGNSFLESGYVYAPYVPLQVTPTIFGVEDFVPRKGVMTRYAKKMVRPDMYGLVIVKDFSG